MCVVEHAERAVVHGETHFGGFGRNVQFFQEPAEQRIVFRIVDDEAGVDAVSSSAHGDVMGMGVAAKPVFLFKQHDLMLLAQGPCRTDAGDAAADDRDSHADCRLTCAGTGLRSHASPSACMLRSAR